MNKEKYLKRIGAKASESKADLDFLKTLQKNHLFSVPFENLDIHIGREITLDLGRFYTKIVKDKRGGFCYELNGIFNELLRALGFMTKIVSSRVADNEGKFGKEYDHLAIIVDIDGEQYLADVGFGDFVTEPLLLKLGAEQQDPSGVYRILGFEDDYLEVQKKKSESWERQYAFQNVNRELKEFADMCVFNQTSPESHFTQGKLCSILTAEGRKTLTDKKFIVLKDGTREEAGVGSNREFDEILKREFGIAGNN